MINTTHFKDTDMRRNRSSAELRERSQELRRQAQALDEKAEAAERMESADKLPRPEPVEVEIARSTYQPSKAELEEDMRVNASFEEAIDALVMPARIKRVPAPPRP